MNKEKMNATIKRLAKEAAAMGVCCSIRSTRTGVWAGHIGVSINGFPVQYEDAAIAKIKSAAWHYQMHLASIAA